ncbi:MAG TPA: CBS domain-containing protein [Deltaproteobacteria bacterium]|nr:CBS domain-containing protein [Deltaproteobacteria bacterium]
MNFEEALKTEKIRNLSTREAAVTVSRSMPYAEVRRRLREQRSGCAVVLEGRKVVGIFTERDALIRGLIAAPDPATPIENLMTPKPKVLDREDSVAVAIRLMHDGKYRHLPVVDRKKEYLGVVSVRDIIFYLAENFPLEIYNLPPDPHQISTAPEGA